MRYRRSLAVRLTLLAAALTLLAVASGCGRTVPSGFRGVYFNWRAGTDAENVLGEGFHFLLPWNRIYLYDTRVKDRMEKLKILTKDQLMISCDVSSRYHPEAKNVGMIHVEVGEDYYNQIIKPITRNVTRTLISEYTSIEAYLKRNEIQARIETDVKDKLKEKYIIVEAVMLRNMDFPKVVTDAIEQKIAMQQEAEKMQFVLDKEKREAERKQIEAKGISEFQKIVSQGINNNLLRWKGIEATLKLAESSNSKIVVIGSGEDGMPLILGK